MGFVNIKAWILASRPKTLSAAAVPVVVGTAVAYVEDGVHWGPALAALFGAFAIQIGTNFANDLFDALKGADTEERIGPVRAVQAGLLSAKMMGWATAFAFLFAGGFGLYLTWVGGWPVVAIGVASIISGLAYTGGPWALAYTGLGDIFVLVFFGFVAVMGTVYVQTLSISWLSFWVSIPVGMLATAILVVNNLRDREQDMRAAKRTLVVRFGRRFGVWEYVVLLGSAYMVPVILVASGYSPIFLVTWITLPLVIPLVRSVFNDDGAVLNQTLAQTARLLLVFGLVFAVAIAWTSS